jgi:hypothetical protein
MDKDESEREEQSEEYQRFEALARKLLTVPKEQVEQAKRETREPKRRNRRVSDGRSAPSPH